MSDIVMQEQKVVRPTRTSRAQAQRLVRVGVWIVFGAIVPIGLWTVLAQLSLAVVAPAVVKVDLNRRPVQHLEGGIVRSVLVRDGQRVKAGDTVLLLGDVAVNADLNRLAYRIHVERAAMARLEAEQTHAAKLVFPASLLSAAQEDERVKQAQLQETALFQARRESLDSEVALMHKQRGRIEQEMVALRAQIEQAELSHTLQKSDLASNQGLVTTGFVSQERVRQLEATVVDYGSRVEERRSELARAAQRQVDADLRIRSAENAYMQAANDELKVTAARLTELEQELRKSEDASARQVVTAPASGQVIDLKFTSPGAVVRPGDTIAEIVPSDAKLTIEAHVRPEDVNSVYLEQPARVKFSALKYRNALMARGMVSYISADRLIDETTRMPYYGVTIVVDDDSLFAAGELKLHAGMPAEVYIEGITQTPLQYLTDPITSVVRRSGRQM